MKDRRILSIVIALLMVLSVAVIVPCDSYAVDQGNAAAPSKFLLPKVVSKGSRDLVITWNKVDRADGYDVDIYKCKEGALQKVAGKTFRGNDTFKWTKKNLKKQTGYKVIVCAWRMKDGVKDPMITKPFPRPRMHVYTSGGNKKYSNPKSITLSDPELSMKEGDTHRIEAKVNKLQKGKKLIDHIVKLRYFSTDPSVAEVNTFGRITAWSKGKCKIYVYAANGVRKTVSVTVN